MQEIQQLRFDGQDQCFWLAGSLDSWNKAFAMDSNIIKGGLISPGFDISA
jgi:hypothetical protein